MIEQRTWTRRNCLKWIFSGLLFPVISGCGTLMYPERRGQPAGRLDWRVVLLDGIGLFIFFIPGVVAFAVDFLNGTIYLPPEPTPCEPPCLPTGAKRQTSQLRKISVPRGSLTPEGIEAAILHESGQRVSLSDGKYVARRMESIDDFWRTKASLEGHSLSSSGATIS